MRLDKSIFVKHGKAIFVSSGIFVILVLSLSICFNYWIDRMESRLTGSGFFLPPATVSNSPSGEGSKYSANPGKTTGSAGNPGSPGTPSSSDNPPGNQAVVSAVQQKVKAPLNKRDVATAGLIILRRLSTDEISLLYGLGTRGKMSAQDYDTARSILRTKLTPEEIRVLQDLGTKYGKNLSWLS